MARHREAVEMLGEVLHHIVALGLAVDEDVQTQVLLQSDDACDLLAQEPVVLPRGELSSRVRRASTSDVCGLREGADGRRGQDRKIQVTLRLPTRFVVDANEVGIVQCCRALPHRTVTNTRRRGTVGERGRGVVEVGPDRLDTLTEPEGQRDDLRGLLVGEGQPAREARVEVGLVGHVVRYVLQRRRRGGHDPCSAQSGQRAEVVPGALQVTAPDVAAVDDTSQEHLLGEARYGRRNSAASKVERDRVDRCCREHAPGVVGELRVPGGHQELRSLGGCTQHGVGALGGVSQLAVRQRERLTDQRRLVELHPIGARVAELREERRVDGQEVVEPVEGAETVGCAVGRLREGEERHRSHEHGPREVALGARLAQLRGEAVARPREHRLRPDLGNEVVVVGVEPLRHLERRSLLVAAGDREVRRQTDGAVGIPQRIEPRRDGSDRHRQIEDLVVVRERLRDGGVVASEPEARQVRARLSAQRRRGLLEFRLRGPACPVRLDRALELATSTDAGVAEDRSGGEGHAGFSCSRGRMPASRSTASTVS